MAKDLDSDDRVTREAALIKLDKYLGILEPWAAATWVACRGDEIKKEK